MKALVLSTALIIFPYTVQAQNDFQGSLNTVTISDANSTNEPPTAIFTYTQDGDTFTFDASSSIDPDGSINQYKWDLGDGTSATGSQVVHTYTDLTSVNVTLTVIDNVSSISITQQEVSSQESVAIAINFQPANVEAPSDYSVDSGLIFDSTRGYGWTSALTSDAGWRDRNNTISPDQAYDTLVFIKDTVIPQATWELSVPYDGYYNVTVCMGDPTYGNDIQEVQIEGVSVISGESLTTDKRWIEKSSLVNVVDGKLTLTFAGSTTYARLCWIKVENN